MRVLDVSRYEFTSVGSGYLVPFNDCYPEPINIAPSVEVFDISVNGVNFTSDIEVYELHLRSGLEQDSKNTIQVHGSFPTADMQARQADVWRIGIGENGGKIIYQSRIQQPNQAANSPAWVWPPPQSYQPVTEEAVTGDYGQVVQWV
jgi:hypothetical protein